MTRHRHIPEMEQELTKLAGSPVKVRFTPHLIPVSRGMVSTIHLPMKREISAKAIREAYLDHYKSEPFVRVLPVGVFPDTAHVRGSNQCHIALEVDERTGWGDCDVRDRQPRERRIRRGGSKYEPYERLNETAGLLGFTDVSLILARNHRPTSENGEDKWSREKDL